MLGAKTPKDRNGANLISDPRLERRVGLLLIGFFFFGFLGFAAFIPLDAAVVGQGVVKVSGNRQTMQFRDGGTISQMHVREGDRVAKDQLLVSFGAQDLLAEERALSGMVIELEATRARLIAELDGKSMQRPASWKDIPAEDQERANEVFGRHARELRARRASMRDQLGVISRRAAQTSVRRSGYAGELESLERQITLIGEELSALTDLAKDGFAPESRVRAVERQKAELEGRRSQLISAIAQSREAVGENQMQSLSLRSERRESYSEELRAIEQKLVELVPSLAQVRHKIARTQLRSPHDGVVVGMRVFNPGEVVQPADPIMYIVPDRALMVIEVPVAPNDVDDLRAGAKADVRFPGLTGRTFNRADGSVHRISADSFKDERTGRDYYLAEVHVSREQLDALAQKRGAEEIDLRPGLHAEVVVPLRQRSALQYILEPLNQALWRSFREH